MPIDTPNKALLLTELPTATANDAGIQAIVATSAGAKKLPIQHIFEPYSILVGSYLHYSHYFPTSFAVPMMGGVLDPEDFEDRLQALKQRIPDDWILDDGKVQLPIVLDHVLQQDVHLHPGDFQEDAMQNATGSFGGAGRVGTAGIFTQSGVIGYQANTNRSDNWATSIHMDLSRHVRTADHTRERTLNTVLCILTGKNKATETQRYYMIDPEHGEYLGWFVNLAVGKNGQGIGYNPLLMTQKEPTKHNQATLAGVWKNEISSDPLGLAMQMKMTSSKKWPFEYFDEIYRTFRIAGKDVFITATATGVQVIGGDGNDSITFSGTPAYETNALWGSSYGVAYNSTSVVVSGRDFSSFSITGLPTVNIWFRTKSGNGILSLKSNNKELDSTWWGNLTKKCPSEKKADLQAWLSRMPNGVFNAANLNDTLDSLPRSRFYFYSTKYKAKTPSQADLRMSFQSAQVVDNLGLYDAARVDGFSLENFLSKEQREFYFLGKKLTLFADRKAVKWQDDDGYYLKIKATPEIGNYVTIDAQNTQICYQITTKNWYFGGPSIAEINATDGYSGKILFFVKDNIVLCSMSVYLDFSKIQVCLTKAPVGREDDLKKVFAHLPNDWDNTLNQDNIGNINGSKESRFWMMGENKLN